MSRRQEIDPGATKAPKTPGGWLKIDDGFQDHAKVEPLSDGAMRLWLRAGCWCRKKENRHTNGFVPRDLLEVISKRSAPRSKLLKFAQELVDARAGGTKKFGLWEEEENGWRFHDWHQYQPNTGDEEPEPMSRSEAASIAGKRSAEARRERNGTAQPQAGSPNVPNVVRESFEAESPNEAPNSPRTSRTSFEPPDPVPVPGPNPDPNQGRSSTSVGERSESLEAESGVHRSAPPGPPEADEYESRETTCPLDLDEKAEGRGVLLELAMALGVGLPELRHHSREFVTYWTVSKGMGAKKLAWMRVLRKRLCDLHSEGRLVLPSGTRNGPVQTDGGFDPSVKYKDSFQ